MNTFFQIVTGVVCLVAAAAVAALLCYLAKKWKDHEKTSQGLDVMIKALAVTAAGVFFAWKVFAGWLIMNMTVSIRTERVHAGGDTDHLAIFVCLDKGSTDSVHVINIGVQKKDLGTKSSKPEVVEVSGFGRLDTQKYTINWEKVVERDPIAISPGEKTEYATYTTVGRNEPVLISAVVLGNRIFSEAWAGHPTQWRTSSISLPVADNKENGPVTKPAKP